VSKQKEVVETYAWKWTSLGEMSGGKKILVVLGHSMSLSDCTVGEKQESVFVFVFEELENEMYELLEF